MNMLDDFSTQYIRLQLCGSHLQNHPKDTRMVYSYQWIVAFVGSFIPPPCIGGSSEVDVASLCSLTEHCHCFLIVILLYVGLFVYAYIYLAVICMYTLGYGSDIFVLVCTQVLGLVMTLLWVEAKEKCCSSHDYFFHQSHGLLIHQDHHRLPPTANMCLQWRGGLDLTPLQRCICSIWMKCNTVYVMRINCRFTYPVC